MKFVTTAREKTATAGRGRRFKLVDCLIAMKWTLSDTG